MSESVVASLVHLDDVPPELQDSSQGWDIAQFRLPITPRDGSSSAVFHGRFLPGSRHAVHRHDAADELCIYLRGRGLAGAGEDRLVINEGHARLMPRGVEHFYYNAMTRGPSEVLGLYVGAGGVAESGYVYCGQPSASDLEQCEQQANTPKDHLVSHVSTSGQHAAALGAGWFDTDYRQLVATTDPPHAFAFAAAVAPGGSRALGRTAAESVYYVHSGTGMLELDGSRVSIRPGHVCYVPAGQLSGIRNVSTGSTLEIFGYQMGVNDTDQLSYEQVRGQAADPTQL